MCRSTSEGGGSGREGAGMTREELRDRIRTEVGMHGHALIPAGELWAAFSARGEDASVSFDDSLRGFAAVNAWEVRRGDTSAVDHYSFHPKDQVLPPSVNS